MIHLFNKFLQAKIIVSFIVLISFCQFTQAQVTGDVTVEPNSTYRYEYNNSGPSIRIPIWTITGGTEVWQGIIGTVYYVDVLWGGVGTGTVSFYDKIIPKGTLNNIVIAAAAPPSSGISSDQNYIHSSTPRIATTNVSTLTNDEKIESITYFDGLGRGMQSVGIRAGGNSEDIITHIDYDEYGRQVKTYLPYASDVSIASYRTSALGATGSFYDATKYEADFPSVAVNDINAYSQKELESSPLSRVLKQAAPGKDWKLGVGNEIEFEYETNTATEVRFYEVSLTFSNNTYTPTLTGGTTYYSTEELYKTVTKDENHDGSSTKNHTTEEFKDKQGRVVLKRTYNNSIAHDTYYVYDKFGNLSYVLPPKPEPNTAKPDATELSELCYQYKYDDKNRLVEKKIPGKGWEYIVYNKLDQPIMTQDAIQNAKSTKEWLFTKYDVFGRVAYTGLTTTNSSRSSIQSTVNGISTQWVTKSSTVNTIDNTTIYYDNGAHPTSIADIYTINYYDNYTFDGFTNFPSTSQGQAIINYNNSSGTQKLTKGLATGSKVRVLGTSNWITTFTGYDEKGRAIYVKSVNDYLSTTDIVQSQLDFAGAVDKTETSHVKGGTSVITEDLFTYDHTGRLIKQTQELNNTNVLEVIAENNYDELGQLESKGVGGKTTQNRLQNVDYTYNIRGWLKQINNPTSLGTDLFGFKINYNTVDHTGIKLYNGNIAETEWKTQNDNSLRWYKYGYDALNRITSGIDNTLNQEYTLQSITYDKNGNIETLIRRGHKVVNPVSGTVLHFGKMDDLAYTYQPNSNKLLKVSDNGYDSYGFKDDNIGSGADPTNDYTYDANGNMTKDDNKEITAIAYNHLNLPTLVTLSGGNISYFYDATGVKLKKIVSNGGSTSEYAGNYVYEDSSLKFFNHTEGYVEPDGSGGYDYVYQYKDHLGNVRLSYKDSDNSGSVTSSEILEENNYYPFGLKHKGYNGNATSHIALNYKFGGKELSEELGLNTYDFGARNYDAALGRWFNIDPFAEFMRNQSPYNFGFNNPIYFSDYEGNIPWPVPEVWKNWIIANLSHWHNKTRPNHQGLDVNFSGGGNTDLGAPIVATHSGKVVFVKTTTTGQNGREVRIESPDGSFMTRYLHLSSTTVKEGQEINEGATIGLMGGSANGSEMKIKNQKGGRLVHLHYEIHKNNGNGFVIGKKAKGNTSINPWNGSQPVDPQLWIKPNQIDFYNEFDYQMALFDYENEEARIKQSNKPTGSSTPTLPSIGPVVIPVDPVILPPSPLPSITPLNPRPSPQPITPPVFPIKI